MIDGIPFDTPDGYWNYGTWPSELRESGPRRNAAEGAQQNEAIRVLTGDAESVLYALELHAGIIKIGYTRDLTQRRGAYPGCTILAFHPGDRADERAIHESLAKFRAYGREYYHPTPEVIAVVNEMRDYFNLPHIAA